MQEPMFEVSSNPPKLDRRCVSPFFTDDIGDADDDCNALNEETFGADAVEEDWESDHQKLAAELEGASILNDSALDGAKKDIDLDHTDYIVERSVKNWVLDDDLDDPAIMRRSNAISKKSMTETIKSIFSRSSPPPPALIDADLTGSPITEGIWTSPQRYESTPAKQVNFLPSLPNSEQRHVSFSHDFVKSTTVPKEKISLPMPPVKILPNVKTLEELENDILNNIKLNSSRSSLTSGIRTLEDVERDIYLKPKAKTVSELEHEASQLASQLPIGTPHLVPQQFRTPQAPAIINKNVSPAMPGSGTLPPQFTRFMNSPNVPFTQTQQQLANNSLNRNFRMVPLNRKFNGVPIPHPLLNNMRPQVRHPQCIPPQRLPAHLMPNDVMSLSPLKFPHGLPGHMTGIMNSIPDGNEMETPQDPYAGLMTQQEKEWLIKIQLMQLQSDNPYLDDFYYTSYRMKQIAKEKASQGSSKGAKASPKLVLPNTRKIEQKVYTPTQYQGSLGKIQVLSVNNPRKMIDKIEKNAEDDEEAKKLTNRELRRYRRGLVDIEKMFDNLLEYDDIEKKMLALPAESHGPHIEQRSQLLSALYDCLGVSISSEKLTFIMSIRKGKRLVARAFPSLNKEQQLKILEAMLQNITAILKRDQVDQVLLESVHDVEALIGKSEFLELMKLSHSFAEISMENNDIKSKNVSPALQSKFVMTIILCMFHRAEEIYKSGNVSLETHTQWSEFVLSLCRPILKTPLSSIAVSICSYPDIFSHIQRFTSNDSEYRTFCEAFSHIMGSKNV